MVEDAGARHPLRVRDFRLIFSGLAISSTGDWLYSIALIVYIFDRTGSATWVGAASILRLIPYLIFGAIGGAVADRYDKRRVLIASDLIRAAAMLVLALLTLVDGPLLLIVLLVFVSTTAGTPDGPAVGSLIPIVCSENQLSKANALTGAVENVAMIIGPALGGLLLLAGSTALAFAINAVTFLVGAFFAYRIRAETSPRGRPDAEPVSIVAQVREGLGIATSSSGIMIMMLFILFAGLFYGHELVLIVLISEEKLGLGSEGVGWLNAAVGLGGVVSAGLASRLAASRRSDLALVAALIGGSAPYAVLSFSDAVLVGFMTMAMIGAASISLDVVATTMLQRTVPDDVLARILSLVDTVAVAGILIGSLIAPPMVEQLGLDGTLLAIGTLPLLAAVAFPRLRGLNTLAEAQMDALAPTVRLLASSSLFEGSSRHSIEAIAAEATHLRVDPGDTVVVEGEPADDIYIIESGNFDVTSQGERGRSATINRLKTGDHFGEVGVLADIPRTASVVATSPSGLIRLPGRILVDLVSREPRASATIMDGMLGRLARTHPSLAVKEGEQHGN